MNIVKHYLDILLAILIMFVFSAVNLSQRQDVLTQAYLEAKARSFIENVRVHGYLSIQMYESFVREVQIVGGRYDIEFMHEKLLFEPEYINNIFTGEVMIYSESCYTDEILEILYEAGIYYMKKDDVISVTLRNNSLSFGMAVFKGIAGSAYRHGVTQSGRIRDVVKEGT